nr:Na/Pi symporter [Oscillospiraceae bacterium]
LGEILLGFGVLMFGMELMSDAVAPLADMPEFSQVLTAFSNPVLGILIGAFITAVIQSSAASVGMLQALSLTGSVTFGAAIPIILGQNIGTCATALISSIGVNRNAKRVSVIHISFNIIGTTLFCVVFYTLNGIFKFSFLENAITPFEIALFHTLFNLATTMVLLPFAKQLEKLACRVVKEKKKGCDFAYLDPHLLMTPTLAIGECTQMASKMGEYSRDFLRDSLDLLFHYSEKRADDMIEDESKLYIYRDSLMPFLIQLCGNDLSPEDSREVTRLLHAVGDFRRIGDHCINIINCATELHEKEIPLPDKENDDLRECAKLLNRLSDAATVLFTENDPFLAQDIYSLERALTNQTCSAKDGYILRLKQGACPLEDGILFNDLLHNMERVSSHHCAIAATALQISRNEL